MARDVAQGRQVQAPPQGVSLLDLQDDEGDQKAGGIDPQEKEELSKAVADAQEKLDRLNKIRRERDEVLKDLKEKIQNDDVSNLLLLNRRSQNVEPQLFAAELEKFRPYQGRIGAAIQASTTILQELETIIRQVEKGKGVKERSRSRKDRQKRVREWERKLESAGEGYNEVRSGLSKGLSYYESLNGVIGDLRRAVKEFVSAREAERNRMVGDIETRQRLAGSPPPLPPSHTGGASNSIESRLANLSLGGRGGGAYGASSPSSYPASPPPPKPVGAYASSSSPYPPPPPPASSQPAPSAYQPPTDKNRSSNPYDFGSLGSAPSPFSTGGASGYASKPAYPSSQASQDRYGQPNSPSYASAPPPPSSSSAYPPPPPSRPSHPSQGYSSQPQSAYPAPPPPPPQQQPSHYPSPPPAQQSWQAAYPAPPPQQAPSRSVSSSYYPPPAPSHQPSYSSPAPAPPGPPQAPQPQYGGYQPYQPGAPTPPPLQQHYGSHSPSQQPYGAYAGGQQPSHHHPPQSSPYGAYQPPQGGYQYR